MKAKRGHTLQTSELKGALGGLKRTRKSVGTLLNSGLEEFNAVPTTNQSGPLFLNNRAKAGIKTDVVLNGNVREDRAIPDKRPSESHKHVVRERRKPRGANNLWANGKDSILVGNRPPFTKRKKKHVILA